MEGAASALANEWWETCSNSRERKMKFLARCPEALEKPNLKVEVQEIIAKFDKKGATNQEETMVKTVETPSPGATGGAESQGACALQFPGATGGVESQGACTLPQSPGATGFAESQGACALPQSLKSTGGVESQGACTLPQSPGATGFAESQGACALPQFPGATGGVESQGACTLSQSPGATGGVESQGACALPQSLKSTGGVESQGACTLPQSPGATGGVESQGACALPQFPGATGGVESQGACTLSQSPGATGGVESQGACTLPQSPGATGGVESQGVCVLPPIQSFSFIEKSTIRIQNKTGDAVKEGQPISEEEVGYPPTTRNAKRKEPGPKEVSATDGEEDVELAIPEFPDMPRPQPQQFPLMQNGGMEVFNPSDIVGKAENTALLESHDQDNDNDNAEDTRLLGDASDASTTPSHDSDLSSGFDDSYPTQLPNMANGNNVDPFNNNNISKSHGSNLTNGTADPKLRVGRQTSEKLGREDTSNLAVPNHVHPRSS